MPQSHRLVLKLILPVAVFAISFGVADAARPVNHGGGTTSPSYTIVPFEPAGADSFDTQIKDMNDLGAVVGTVSPPHNGFASWHLDMSRSVYTPLTGTIESINNSGQFAGWVSEYFVPGKTIGLFQSGLAAEPVPLSPLPGDDECAAYNLSDGSIIVGMSWHTDGDSTAVAWRAFVATNGTVSIDGPISLSPLAGHLGSQAWRINNAADGAIRVVGDSFIVDQPFEGVTWTLTLDSNGKLETASAPNPIGTLGLFESQSYSYGKSINSLGDACGESDLLPVVRLSDGPLQALPVPQDTQNACARDINELRDIVGDISTEKVSGARIQRRQFPCLWSASGATFDLNKLIPQNVGWDQLWTAHRINFTGMIAGRGRYAGQSRGFIMSPGE